MTSFVVLSVCMSCTDKDAAYPVVKKADVQLKHGPLLMKQRRLCVSHCFVLKVANDPVALMHAGNTVKLPSDPLLTSRTSTLNKGAPSGQS